MTEGPKLEFGSAAALHLHAQIQPLSRLQDEFRDHSLGGDVSHRVSAAASNVDALLRAGSIRNRGRGNRDWFAFV